ncbi:MAG: L,D-transpeptidase [Ktedonobacterales bacterium]
MRQRPADIFRRLFQRETWLGNVQRRLGTVALGMMALLLIGISGYGALSYTTQNTARSEKVRLDAAIATVRAQVNAPDSLIQPIQAQEASVAAADDGTIGGNQRAAAVYSQLYQKVVVIQQTSPAQARALAQSNLTQLTTAVGTLKQGNYVEAPGYAQRLTQAQRQFDSAATTKDYFTADRFIEGQLTAANDFQPTLTRLHTFQKLEQSYEQLLGVTTGSGPQSLQCAQGQSYDYWVADSYVTVTLPQQGPAAPIEAQWAAQDQTLFRAAATPTQYDALNQLLAHQTQQLLADENTTLPGVANALAQTLQSDVQALQSIKADPTTLQQQITQDQQTLAGHPTFDGYVKLVTTMRQQQQAVAFPLLKAKTKADLANLAKLVAQGQASTTTDPANGQKYPNAYEYNDSNTGIGDPTQRLANAQTTSDYQLVDQEILMFTANIQAMLTNLSDKTPRNKPHQTDLQLLQNYGLMSSGKVLVVSLREQAARFYDNGQLVKQVDVTTGAPDLPSIPGVHCVLDKQTNTLFISPDPKGSPNYYAPTKIHFALYYSYYGYELHDAWWRSWFGKYSNLPHYDPSSFNGGSHGCINFNYYNGDSAWLYNWSPMGMPVIVY